MAYDISRLISRNTVGLSADQKQDFIFTVQEALQYQQETIERLHEDLARWQKQSSQQSELTDNLKARIERLTEENHEYQTALGLIESEWVSTPNDKGLIASKSLLNVAQFAAKTLLAENEILHRKLGLYRAGEANDGE